MAGRNLYLTGYRDGAALPDGFYIADPEEDGPHERLRLLQIFVRSLGYEWTFKRTKGGPSLGVTYVEVEP